MIVYYLVFLAGVAPGYLLRHPRLERLAYAVMAVSGNAMVALYGLKISSAREFRQALPLEILSAMLIALLAGAVFSAQLMFGFFGVLLPLAMLLVFSRPWYFSVLPGLVCVAANQWQVLLNSGNLVAMFGLATCLIAPLAGLVLLRQVTHVSPPAMRRWAYALYPAHFLLLLLLRKAIT